MRLARTRHRGNTQPPAVVAEDVLLGGSRGEGHRCFEALHKYNITKLWVDCSDTINYIDKQRVNLTSPEGNMKIKTTLVLFLILAILPPSIAQAAPKNGTPSYKQGFYYPWQKGKTAEVTKTSHEGGAIDVIIGTLTTPVSDRPKQKVTAAKDGFIIFAKDDSNKSCNLKKGQKCDDDANLVVIEHPGNPKTYSWYWHLAKGSIPSEFKSVGTPVRHGEVIGKQGNTGTIDTTSEPKNGGGTHLHFFISEGYKKPENGRRLPEASKIISDFQFTKEKNSPFANKLKLNAKLGSNNTPNKILQVSAGKYCMDIKDWQSENFGQIQVWRECTLKDNQIWSADVRKPANFWLKSSLQNSAGEYLCIDVTNGDPGKQLQVYGCVSATINTNQVWQFVPLSDGKYQIKSPTFGMCMMAQDLEGDSSPVLLTKCDPKNALQKWTITER